MDPKWRLLLVLLTAWTLVILAFAQKTCKPPRNPQRITAVQLEGVWSMQMSVNFGDLYFNYTCSRNQYNFANRTDGMAAYSVIIRSDGEYSLYLLRTDILMNQVLSLSMYTDPMQTFLYYFLLINDNEFVASVCYYDKGVLLQQYEIVSTRSQTTSEAHAVNLLRQAGVTYTDSSFFNNSEDCYKA